MTQRVVMVIRSYLRAWDKSLPDVKANILTSKISAVHYYQSDRNFQRQILFAIEVFLSECRKDDTWQSESIK